MNYQSFINPLEWIRAYRFHRQQKSYDKSSFDLELWLYGKLLNNGMLHYGYFEDRNIEGTDISIADIENAQVAYARYVCDKVDTEARKILDVGCGMGGLAHLLSLKGHEEVHALTPNQDQIKHIEAHYPDITVHHSTYENFSSNDQYDCIINAESLQYIDLEKAFSQSAALLVKGGRWVISEYFRISEEGVNRSGHLLIEFERILATSPFSIIEQHDITLNVLPTLKMVSMYGDRILLPLKHYGFEKLRYKKPWLYHLTEKIRNRLDLKIEKEIHSIVPEQFLKEKKYLCFVIEKT